VNARNIISSLIILLFLLPGTATQAQRSQFYNLKVENGLIQSQAMCLTQDKSGNLWIGTLGGLSRFDGKNFTSYTIRNGMLNNEVNSLATDAQGNIWLGSPVGLSMFNGKTFTHYALPQENKMPMPRHSAQEIKIVNDTAWWCAGGAVYYTAGNKLKSFPAPFTGGYISAMLPVHDDLWLAGGGAIYHMHGNTWDTLQFNTTAGEKSPVVNKIFKDRSGHVWLPTNNGLYKIANGKIVACELKGQRQPVIFSITEDKTGTLWLGTNSGVIRLSGSTVEYYNKRNGLSDNFFYAALTDAEGNVWLASDGQGIFRFSGTQFTALDESMGLRSSQIMSIAADKKGTLYLGTYDAGLFAFENGVVSMLPLPLHPISTISSLCYTHDSKLWIGTRSGGLWRYDNTFRQYAMPEHHFPSNFVTSLYEDTAKRLWIGFVNGAMVYEHDSFKTVVSSGTPVVSFFTIGRDSVLIGAEKKLLLYSHGLVSDFKTMSAPDSSSVQCFILRGRELWLGTSDNGVICYNMETKKSYTINKSNGLQSDFIYNIVTDNDNNIWVGTGYGIDKITPVTGGQPVVTFYGKEQGITGMESNMNSAVKMRDGSLWFGTTNGALHYLPHSVSVSPQPVSIALQSVKIFGENIADTAYFDSTDNFYGVPYHLHLPYKKNNISFTFQSITLSGAQQLLYRYRMDGIDVPWSDWSPTNSVTYSALPPGNYIFHVQCLTTSGQATRELDYPFEINTPFQKTRWFRFAILGACILLGISFQYIMSSRKERRQQLLEKLREEEQAKIRQRTAEDFHDEVGNRLTRINVLTNILKSKIDPTPAVMTILNRIQENTGQLYTGTRDILWSLKPSNDNLYEILQHLQNFGIDLFQDTEVNFTFIGTDEKWHNYRLPLDVSRNLHMIFKEAMNNCLKYSGATTVTLEVHFIAKDALQLILKDNGKGFDMDSIKKGHGINNMNVRAERIHGKLYIDSKPGKGTIVNLSFKIPPNR